MDELNRCAYCGAACDGDTCDWMCSLELAKEKQRRLDDLNQRINDAEEWKELDAVFGTWSDNDEDAPDDN